MKKLILIPVVLFAFTLILNNIMAQTQEKSDKVTVKIEQSQVTPGKFADKNNIGICDNRETRIKSPKGANFVDKNGDGVCDNKGSNCKRLGKGNCCGYGNGNGHQYRNGRGYGYGYRNAVKN